MKEKPPKTKENVPSWPYLPPETYGQLSWDEKGQGSGSVYKSRKLRVGHKTGCLRISAGQAGICAGRVPHGPQAEGHIESSQEKQIRGSYMGMLPLILTVRNRDYSTPVIIPIQDC